MRMNPHEAQAALLGLGLAALAITVAGVIRFMLAYVDRDSGAFAQQIRLADIYCFADELLRRQGCKK